MRRLRPRTAAQAGMTLLTLLELILVVAIILVLLGLTAGGYARSYLRAKEAALKQDEEQARAAPLRFEPQSVTLRPGETTTIGIVAENVQDLFSIPMLLQYDPAVISVEEVRHGGFLSGGTQEIAIVQRIDKERGQAIISTTRQPNTPGVSGTGTLLGIVIRGVASGTSSLAVVQVNAHDSQQKPIPLVSGEASIRVQ
jgi:cohesin domain-containing protein